MTTPPQYSYPSAGPGAADPALTASEEPVAAHDVSVALQGNPILRGVSLRVGPRETVALLGGNGSGKTTLVRTLMRLQPVTAGSIALFGTPLPRFRHWERVGYVPQRGTALATGATVREVVASGRLARRRPFWPASAADRRAVELALRRVDLWERRGQEFVRMSGGQQQRALIARALVGEPELLVLDEPLAGLDLRTQRSLATLLAALKEDGLALLVVLHELGPLEPLIDRSVVLRTGRVIHDGPLQSGPPRSDHHHVEPDTGRGALVGVADHVGHHHDHGER